MHILSPDFSPKYQWDIDHIVYKRYDESCVILNLQILQQQIEHFAYVTNVCYARCVIFNNFYKIFCKI